MNIEEFAREYLEQLKKQKISNLTLRNYSHYLNRFSNFLKEFYPKAFQSPTEINLEIINKFRVYVSSLKDRKGELLGKTTINYHFNSIRSFFRYLIKKGVKVITPERIELFRVEQRVLKTLNQEQIDSLLAQPDTSNIIGLRDKAILETFLSTGLLVSEIVKLDRNQIDLKTRNAILIDQNGQTRNIFLSKSATYWISRYLQARKDDFGPLFIRYSQGVDATKSGEHMRLTTRSIERVVEKYVKTAGLPVKATAHTLRHSFATDLLQAGADLRSVQELLGHKNIATTQIYTHVTNPQLKEVHRKFHSGYNKEKESDEKK